MRLQLRVEELQRGAAMWGCSCGAVVCVYNNNVWWGCPCDQSRGHPQAPLRVATYNKIVLNRIKKNAIVAQLSKAKKKVLGYIKNNIYKEIILLT